MSLQENKEIGRRFIEEGVSKGDLDTLDEILADSFAQYGEEAGSLEAYKQFIAANLIGFPDWHWVAEDIIAEGDKVVVCFKASATHTGEWFGIPPTNKKVEWAGMTCLRIAGGKIVEKRTHWSEMQLHEQLGTIPSWEEMVKQAQNKC